MGSINKNECVSCLFLLILHSVYVEKNVNTLMENKDASNYDENP